MATISENSVLNPYKFVGKIVTEDDQRGYSIAQILYIYKYTESDNYDTFFSDKRYKIFNYFSEQTDENINEDWDDEFASQYIYETVNYLIDTNDKYYKEVLKLSKYKQEPKINIDNIDEDLLTWYPGILYNTSLELKEQDEEQSESDQSSVEQSENEDISTESTEVNPRNYLNMFKLDPNVDILDDEEQFIIYVITPQIEGRMKESKRVYRKISLMEKLEKYTEKQDKIMMEGKFGTKKRDILVRPTEDEYDENFEVYQEIEPKTDYYHLYYRVNYENNEFLNDEYGYSSILITTKRMDLKVKKIITSYLGK